MAKYSAYRARCKCNYIMWSCSYLLLKSKVYEHLRRCRTTSFNEVEIKRITKQEYHWLCEHKHDPYFWNVVRNGIAGMSI